MIKKLIDKLFYKKYEITIWQRGYLSNYYRAHAYNIKLVFYKKLNSELLKKKTWQEIGLAKPKGMIFYSSYDGPKTARYYISKKRIK